MKFLSWSVCATVWTQMDLKKEKVFSTGLVLIEQVNAIYTSQDIIPSLTRWQTQTVSDVQMASERRYNAGFIH